MSKNRTFVVHEAQVEDVGKGIGRIHPQDMADIDLAAGDVIEVIGSNKTVTKVTPMAESHPYRKIIQIDGITRENAGVGPDDFVEIKKTDYNPAETLLISPIDATRPLPQQHEAQQLTRILARLPVIIGDKLEVHFFGVGRQYFVVEGTIPQGAIVINPNTLVKVQKSDISGERALRVSYEDIGGLDTVLQKVREIIEFPTKYPELFKKLGIEAPNGVLLVGLSGVGKTLIARAIASEIKAHFIHVNGPEIMHKFYEESEAKLRHIFDEANANTPSIIFINEIDAIAPKRTESIGNVEKRVVAQLLVLMDGLVDPALIRSGRFDYIVRFDAPEEEERLEIFRIHTKDTGIAISELKILATMSEGFVGSDIESVCRRAQLVAMQKYFFSGNRDAQVGEGPRIDMDDFKKALEEVKERINAGHRVGA